MWAAGPPAGHWATGIPPPATGPAVPEMTPVLLFPRIHMQFSAHAAASLMIVTRVVSSSCSPTLPRGEGGLGGIGVSFSFLSTPTQRSCRGPTSTRRQRPLNDPSFWTVRFRQRPGGVPREASHGSLWRIFIAWSFVTSRHSTRLLTSSARRSLPSTALSRILPSRKPRPISCT